MFKECKPVLQNVQRTRNGINKLLLQRASQQNTYGLGRPHDLSQLNSMILSTEQAATGNKEMNGCAHVYLHRTLTFQFYVFSHAEQSPSFKFLFQPFSSQEGILREATGRTSATGCSLIRVTLVPQAGGESLLWGCLPGSAEAPSLWVRTDSTGTEGYSAAVSKAAAPQPQPQPHHRARQSCCASAEVDESVGHLQQNHLSAPWLCIYVQQAPRWPWGRDPDLPDSSLGLALDLHWRPK